MPGERRRLRSPVPSKRPEPERPRSRGTIFVEAPRDGDPAGGRQEARTWSTLASFAVAALLIVMLISSILILIELKNTCPPACKSQTAAPRWIR